MIFEKLICVKVNKISTEIKVHLSTLDSNRSETFPLGLHWGCTHCSWYFGQFFQEDLLKGCDVLGMLLGNTDFQLPLRFSNKFRFQGVARPLKILKSFFYFASSLLPRRCVWNHCHAGRFSHVSVSILSLMERGLFSFCFLFFLNSPYIATLILCLIRISLPVLISTKAAPKHVSTLMLHIGCSWDASQHSFPFKHRAFITESSIWYHRTTLHYLHPLLDSSDGLWSLRSTTFQAKPNFYP